MMKKSIKNSIVFLLMMIMVLSVTACSNSHNKEKETGSENALEYVAKDIKVAAMKGPTGMGMVKLMQDAKDGKTANNYEFTLAGGADAFTASLVKGDIQLAAVPCNVASTLYNKSGGKIKVVGINTLGVLYIMETQSTKNPLQSVADLKGRTIYLTGKGTTPEYTLRHLLKSAGLDPDKDVKMEFKSEATEVVAAMQLSSNNTVVCMLPQPYATTVIMNDGMMQVALDVTKEWEKLNGTDSTVVTGVLVANAEYYNNNKAAVEKFMEEYKASVDYVNAHVNDAAQLVEDFGIIKAAVAKKAIPQCNITFVEGKDMKTKVENYLKVLYDENPAAVGGAMPDDAFYVTE